MKTFLKVLLILMIAIVAVKLLPFTLALGCVLGGVLLLALGLGLSALVVLLVASVALLAVLSPIWIPILAIVGLVALIKRLSRRTAAP